MPERRGIGGIGIDAPHASIIRERIAVSAEKCAPRRALGVKFGSAHVTRLQVGVPVLQTHHMHHAVAIDENILSLQRRVLRIRTQAEIGAVEAGGNFAFDLEIVDIAFHANRRSVAAIYQ